MMNKQVIQQLQQHYQIVFRNPQLLEQAFTHSSYVNEHASKKHNERLEYLGDAVLELAVTEYLYRTFPHRSEGELTSLRAAIVCEPSLCHYAGKLQFGDALLLGRGEEMSGGRERAAILADAFEAFIGALYLDQGMDAVRTFLEAVVLSAVDDHSFAKLKDAKSRLQEHVQKAGLGPLQYRLLDSGGPSHNKRFTSEVLICGETYGSGSGKTKKESEQQAAAAALKKLDTGKP